MACLWNMIDAYLVEQLTADMGAAGDYTTLQLATVAVGETLDIAHGPLPYCRGRGVDARHGEPGPHGDGYVHFDDIEYLYDIILVTDSAVAATAWADAKELYSRVREWLRGDFYLGGLSDGTETVTRSEIGEGHTGVRGVGGQNRGKYLGWASLQLSIFSRV
jgi:hypothetical protein